MQKWLRIDASQANAMVNELVKQNIAPESGTAAAVKPMYGGSHTNNLFGRPTKFAETSKAVFDAHLVDDQRGGTDPITDAHDDVVLETLELISEQTEEITNAAS